MPRIGDKRAALVYHYVAVIGWSGRNDDELFKSGIPHN